MKKIINGLRYDTEKAVEVGTATNPTVEQTTDFSYWEAALYKTPRSGHFFLAGEGHAMTRFARHSDGSSGWGEKIIPMSKEEALEWAEQYLDAEDIEEHFADSIKEA